MAISLTAFPHSEIPDRKNTPEPVCDLPPCLIAGIRVDRITLEDAAARIASAVRRRSSGAPLLIMGPNAHLITVAQRDARFFHALNASSLNVPDGISVVLASRLLGRKISHRAPGGELMERLCEEAARSGLSVFFLGGLPGAALYASCRLQRRYPALSVAGVYCPPRGFERNPFERAQIHQLLTDAAPDLLFVAFGAPKQEIWMHENCSTLPIGAAMSVGAAFDTQSGLRKRAPVWTHKLGIEWLYRLMREPRRLWRRYLIGNAHFIYLVLRQRLLFGRLPDGYQSRPFSSPVRSADSFPTSHQHSCHSLKPEAQPDF
ncbi:MAG TPA: WecB/TagA/CpsF family glycosyltransferase [Alloacidobacterium sp.]|nr:WecB/TagA/CpsF family glycosyltransferase [Alloacidobacterium sp.]